MSSPKGTGLTTLAVAAIAAAVGFAAVYVTSGRPDNDKTPGPPAKPALAANAVNAPAAPPAAPGANVTKALATGAMTAFVFKAAPEPLPEVTFTDATGAARSLKDFAGKVVLLNLWATWCTPCREEMPGLDRLQKSLGGDKFEVVALSVDRGGVDASRKFLDGIKVERLKVYVDASARAGGALKAVGMPTTLLIDGHGREIGRYVGPAEWDGPDARALIAASLR